MIPENPIPAGQALNIAFAALLFLGVLSIVADRYARYAAAATIFLLIWLVVQFTGPNLYIAVLILVLAILGRVLVTVITDLSGIELDGNIAPVIDAFLTDTDADQTRERD